MLVALAAVQMSLTSKWGHQCECFLNLCKVVAKLCHHSFIVEFTFYYLLLDKLLMGTFFSAWLLLIPGSKAAALECLEAFASGLYSEIFTVLISLMNRFVIFFLSGTYFKTTVLNGFCVFFSFSGNMYYLKNVFDSARLFISLGIFLENWRKSNYCILHFF